MRCLAWWTAVMLLPAALVGAQSPDPLTWRYQPAALAGLQVDGLPQSLEQRWLRYRAERSNPDEAVVRFVADHLSAVSSEQFDVMAMLSVEDGLFGRLARGTKLGLVTGSVGYVASRLGDLGDPWTCGSVSLAAGFLAGSLFDVPGPASFTLRCGAPDCRLALGWQEKPGFFPRERAHFAGAGRLNASTAGASWTMRLGGQAESVLFIDPFAPPDSTTAGWLLRSSF